MRRWRLVLPILLGGLLHPAFGQQKPPRFQDFPVSEPPYRGPHAVPKIKPGTPAWYFRTRIREAAKQAPNFAGHYVLAYWACGAEGLSYAVVDVKTGAVHFEGNTICCWQGGEHPLYSTIDFRLSRHLLVLLGLVNEAGVNGPHFFQLTNGRLGPVR